MPEVWGEYDDDIEYPKLTPYFPKLIYNKNLGAILRKFVKTEKDEHRIQLLKEILEENPKVGKREELLTEIHRILLSVTQISTTEISDLKKVGVMLEHRKKQIFGNFFNDNRYNITISCTTSDVNAGRQIWRKIRSLFF